MAFKDIQLRLVAAGFPLPKYGADGKYGDEAEKAIIAALEELERLRVPSAGAVEELQPVTRPVATGGGIPVAWMPKASISRIICHWTAGAHKASDFDRQHYHILIESNGKLIRGIPTIDLNSEPKAKAGYAAHTLNCNTGSIGISLCCMAGAEESPFVAGPAPMTAEQWDQLTTSVAQLCKQYGIKPTPKTVLSHAEVQSNLGITQRGKWDYTRLAFDKTVIGAKACGDKLRAEVLAKM